MKYYIDFEFSEYFTRNLLLQKKHTIDLISVGVYCEDGRSYYAVGKQFSKRNCNQWVKDNVLTKLDKTFKKKSNKQIAAEIFDFINPDLGFHSSGYSNSDFRDPNSVMNQHFDKHNVTCINEHYYANPKFITYFGSYDWVLFCSFFGTMNDLPPGFPMYCVDLKQTFDEIQSLRNDDIKLINGYPKCSDEHHSLSDAKFNYDLDNFLNSHV